MSKKSKARRLSRNYMILTGEPAPTVYPPDRLPTFDIGFCTEDGEPLITERTEVEDQ